MDDRRTTWERIARTELEHEGVSPGTGFGRSEGLRMGGKIYAIDKDDELILKLPAERVEELIGTGAGHAWAPPPTASCANGLRSQERGAPTGPR